MPKSKLIVVQSPTRVATPEQVKRQLEKRLEKTDGRVEGHKSQNSRRNLHPRINRFGDVILTIKPMEVWSVKKITNVEGNKATIVSPHEPNFYGPQSKLDEDGRWHRRKINQVRAAYRKHSRRRRKHGRTTHVAY